MIDGVGLTSIKGVDKVGSMMGSPAVGLLIGMFKEMEGRAVIECELRPPNPPGSVPFGR